MNLIDIADTVRFWAVVILIVLLVLFVFAAISAARKRPRPPSDAERLSRQATRDYHRRQRLRGGWFRLF